ncbi:MAG: L,D-transpeptidase [Acidimicrobiales bacterium]
MSTTVPEAAAVWRDGSVAYSTAANTGVEGAATAVGTWPVYARYVSTTMSGTNLDGSHYDDPGVPWVSYFHGGDALHGFVRASYGYPQSLGCVEMPPSNAAVVYPYTPIGTLVTIEPNGSVGPKPPPASTTTTTTVPASTTTTS